MSTYKHTFQIPDNLLTLIERLAQHTGGNKSKLVYDALKWYIGLEYDTGLRKAILDMIMTKLGKRAHHFRLAKVTTAVTVTTPGLSKEEFDLEVEKRYSIKKVFVIQALIGYLGLRYSPEI